MKDLTNAAQKRPSNAETRTGFLQINEGFPKLGDVSESCSSLSRVPVGDHDATITTRPEMPAFPLAQHEQRANITSIPNTILPSYDPASRATTPEIPDNYILHNTGNTSVLSVQPVSASRLPIKESLGLPGLVTIIGGSVVVLILLSFLMFLWFGHGGRESADATWTWRQIALRGWMTQSITLTSLGLRFTISMQSAVCTSMLAALVLEKRFTSKSDVAWFSIIRSTNDGPLKMLRMMLSSKILVRYVEFWLLSLLAVTTLGLQFASTILLSDITDSTIVSNMRQTQMPDLFDLDSRSGTFVSDGFFGSLKPVYGVFGELDADYNVLPDARGLSQTGLVQRAFLPLERPHDRISTRYFRGNAIVMSSKTACMRSRIYDISITYSTEPWKHASVFSIEGRLQYGLTIREAQGDGNTSCFPRECEEIAFNCSIPTTYASPDNFSSPWQSVVCYIDVVGGQIDRSLKRPRWNSSQQPWSDNTPISLIISTNINDEHQLQPLVKDPPGIDNGEWRSYEVATGVFVNISLCFHAFTADRKLVATAASWDLEEPIIQWSFASLEYNTSDVKRYIGSNLPRSSPADRGILDLHILGEPDDGPPTSPANTEWLLNRVGNVTPAMLTPLMQEWTQYQDSAYAVNTTVATCYHCELGYVVLANPEIGLLFSDTIALTSRPANALLAFYTIITLTIHDLFLSARNILQDAHIVSTTTVRAPSKCKKTGCRGLVAVTVLLGVHLLYVAVITILYTIQIRHSRYGNIWHAVSQLISDETKETLDAANNKSDESVFEDDEGEGRHESVKLVALENGRSEVVKHYPDMEPSGSPWVTRLRENLPKVTLVKRKQKQGAPDIGV